MKGAPFLLEIGVEELPASFVDQALASLPELAERGFKQARLTHGVCKALATPRRVALLVEHLAERQEDLREVLRGPARAVAVAADGSLTKAGESFARKSGVAPAHWRWVESDKGVYPEADRQEIGRHSLEVLPSVLPEICRALPFPKTMRWGAGEAAFGRPVQWLVALHGTEIVACEFAAVQSGRRTRGHRFLAPQSFDLASPSEYVAQLRQAFVLVDPEERRAQMRSGLDAAAAALDGHWLEDSRLLEECPHLVEWPHALSGNFSEEFLLLPQAVILAVMRDHQRYFALQRGGKLLPHYVNVVNTAQAPAAITRGNDRVLRARLEDARFFAAEDGKLSLAEHAHELSRVVFHAKLGTLEDKRQRLSRLIDSIAAHSPATFDGATARLAAELCKADLVTLMVGEFPELQGSVGEHLALQQGIASDVAAALHDHYLPRSTTDELPRSSLGFALALVDRIDTLVGCFAAGLRPSGSADPFALRRAALGCLRLQTAAAATIPLQPLASLAYDLFAQQRAGTNKLAAKEAVLASLDDFLRTRARSYWQDHQGQPADIVDASLAAWSWLQNDFKDLAARIEALSQFRTLPAYSALALAFKRAFHLTREQAANLPAGAVQTERFEMEAEHHLWRQLEEIRGEATGAIERGDYPRALQRLASLREPMDRFFTEVFIMADDTETRHNRLRVLATAVGLVQHIAHFDLLLPT